LLWRVLLHRGHHASEAQSGTALFPAVCEAPCWGHRASGNVRLTSPAIDKAGAFACRLRRIGERRWLGAAVHASGGRRTSRKPPHAPRPSSRACVSSAPVRGYSAGDHSLPTLRHGHVLHSHNLPVAVSKPIQCHSPLGESG